MLLTGESMLAKRVTVISVERHMTVDCEKRAKLITLAKYEKNHGDFKKKGLKTMMGDIDGKWQRGAVVPYQEQGETDVMWRNGSTTSKSNTIHGHTDNDDRDARSQRALMDHADDQFNSMHALMDQCPVRSLWPT